MNRQRRSVAASTAIGLFLMLLVLLLVTNAVALNRISNVQTRISKVQTRDERHVCHAVASVQNVLRYFDSVAPPNPQTHQIIVRANELLRDPSCPTKETY